jgi:multicomponent Na+:H+ antiporter subunit D
MPSELFLVPACILFFGVITLAVLPERLRSRAFLVFPLLAFVLILNFDLGLSFKVHYLGYELVLLEVTHLSKIFGLFFALITFFGGIYAFHIKDQGQQLAALLYAGGTLGLTFAGDYLSLLVFWEIMALSSTYLIWASRSKAATAAGMRYLLMHLFGGALLLAGILLYIADTGSIALVPLSPGTSWASWLILWGILLNTAAPPLHAWLADAYPEATVTGAAFLSALTTKSAVLVLLKIFAGWQVLMYLGVFMALYGMVYAILANDIRRILAYHIISQVGYMVAGIGIGTEMALNGAVAHAVNNVLYKTLLFMGTGVVLHTTGKSKLTDLGGLFQYQPKVFFLYMIGGLSISGVPLFNGFLSKTMIISAAGAAQAETVMLLLLLASIGTFFCLGLKIPYFTWFSQPKSRMRPSSPPKTMLWGMAAAAFCCVLIGLWPSLLYLGLPYAVDHHPFTVYQLTESVQILSCTFLAFWLMRDKLVDKAKISLDLDWLYRAPARYIRKIFVEGLGFVFYVANQITLWLAGYLVQWSRNPAFSWQRGGQSKDFDPDEQRQHLELPLVLLLLTCMVFFVIIFFF